jgi:hypothetical protein
MTAKIWRAGLAFLPTSAFRPLSKGNQRFNSDPKPLRYFPRPSLHQLGSLSCLTLRQASVIIYGYALSVGRVGNDAQGNLLGGGLHNLPQ